MQAVALIASTAGWYRPTQPENNSWATGGFAYYQYKKDTVELSVVQGQDAMYDPPPDCEH